MIRYDVADLQATARRLEESVDVAREVEGSAGGLAGGVADCGSAELADAGRHLLDRWGYGMGVLAEDADALAQALRQVSAGYEQRDEAGAAALREQRP